MSQENVELWRAQIEEFRQRASEVDPEAAVSTMVELWDSDVTAMGRREVRRADNDNRRSRLTGLHFVREAV